ncbi:MAG: uroporphyrinogen decarboxylase family protein [Eubacteriales bacterium]
MPLTSKERFTRMYQHRDADRIPIIDGPWGDTVERWHREGMPRDISFVDYFDLDRTAYIGVDNSPRYEAKTVEDTPEYVIYTTGWGATMKSFKNVTSTPEFLDFKVNTAQAWVDAKRRMTPDRNRVNWEWLKNAYPAWQKDGSWIIAGFWFGFDVAHSWMMGTETMLVAMLEEPGWVSDVFNTYLDLDIAQFDMIYDEGYRFDCISWPDDMGYKGSQFFSKNMYRELLKSVHARAVKWAHDHGAYAHLHSCGDVRPLIPELLDIGVDALNPLEVKAGMDTLELKKLYGDKLVLHGGINAVLWDDTEAITSEMKAKIPALKENGGYIFSSDHSVPNTVSLENFRYITDMAKKLGSY